MAYQGSERTWFDAGGRRLRLEVSNEAGDLTLLFILQHDSLGRESEAIYFEDGSPDPDREVFTYSGDGRLMVTTYFYEPGVASDRTESELDGDGREIRKRYYRADGTQYGREDVFWSPEGWKAGWDFAYVGRSGGTSFRYEYDPADQFGEWTRRERLRDGIPERVEVRTVVRASRGFDLEGAFVFARGRISTEASEASPSFSADARTMVFARYGADWEVKVPHIAEYTPNGWLVQPLEGFGAIYNLAIAPDAGTIVFSRRQGDELELFRSTRTGQGWTQPESLTAGYSLVGSYPFLTQNGDLVYYDSSGQDGSGIYISLRDNTGFGAPLPLFVPQAGIAFDAHLEPDGTTMLVTRCFDDQCASGKEHGLWEIDLERSTERQIEGLPYVWGGQPVPELGLLVFTDGEDISAVPLRARKSR